MASVVDICNIALSNIRAGTINSIDDNTVQAKHCKMMYPILRDQMLTDNVWQFATRLKPLSLLTSEVFGWTYVYKYPSDCLYINELIPEYSDTTNQPYLGKVVNPSTIQDIKIEYDVMNVDGVKVIVTNQENLRINYRSREDDASLYDTQFYMTLAYLLAAESAIPLVGMEKGRALRQDNLQLYGEYLRNAIAMTGNQEVSIMSESEFISVRS